ncbi:hypothetical protein PM082_014851 [Marasmius tenuissimus]|nr:hypothetical protein PM082_014851 [Marasmius tenuissimus]
MSPPHSPRASHKSPALDSLDSPPADSLTELLYSLETSRSAPYYCKAGPAPTLTASQLKSVWSRFPQGHFHVFLTHEEYDDLKGLTVDWSTLTESGFQRKDSSIDSMDPGLGKRLTRRCMGFFECGNRDCSRITRAKSTRALAKKQEGDSCGCDNPANPDPSCKLIHRSCNNKGLIIKSAAGVWYCNGIEHRHPQIPQKLHLSRREKTDLKEMLKDYPTARPAAL